MAALEGKAWSPAAGPALRAVLVHGRCSANVQQSMSYVACSPLWAGWPASSSFPPESPALPAASPPSCQAHSVSELLHLLLCLSWNIPQILMWRLPCLFPGLCPNTRPSVSSFLTRESKTGYYFTLTPYFMCLKAT